MATKAKSVGCGEPKATKTYGGISVKNKETAAKTKRNEGGKQTSPDLSNSIIEKKKNQIKATFQHVISMAWVQLPQNTFGSLVSGITRKNLERLYSIR